MDLVRMSLADSWTSEIGMMTNEEANSRTRAIGEIKKRATEIAGEAKDTIQWKQMKKQAMDMKKKCMITGEGQAGEDTQTFFIWWKVCNEFRGLAAGALYNRV